MLQGLAGAHSFCIYIPGISSAGEIDCAKVSAMGEKAFVDESLRRTASSACISEGEVDEPQIEGEAQES
jgi:hypothetical protein